jgi:hypothetical protein
MNGETYIEKNMRKGEPRIPRKYRISHGHGKEMRRVYAPTLTEAFNARVKMSEELRVPITEVMVMPHNLK